MLIDINSLTYPEVQKLNRFKDRLIPVLPWGSIEPHGEQLPYMTDSILAEKVAVGSMHKTEAPCVLLPTIHMGSQNPGQTDKLFCVHFSTESQKFVLEDIVESLERQGLNKLVIINGHNGNNFKAIVRDLEFNHPDFTIYVCNYLDIVERMKPIDKIPFPEIDDHAGFTETCLMLNYACMAMDFHATAEGVKDEVRDSLQTMWTPRNWDQYSINTRIGDASQATAFYGAQIAKFVTDEIAKDLDKIYA